MKKIYVALFILCGVFVGITGCQKSDNYQLMKESKEDVIPIYERDDRDIQNEKSALADLQEQYNSEYISEEWSMEGVEKPGGILCLESEIFVSDKKADCIFKTDYSGNIIKTAGKTGSGKDEFISPGAIAIYNDELYIIDQGNNRVQILDRDLNFMREIALKDRKADDLDYTPGMIAVNQEGVYISGFSLENPTVDKYIEGKYEEAGHNFIGSVFSDENQVYLINSMVRYYDDSNDSFGAATAGPEWLMTIKRNKLEKVCELPHGFNITDFILDNQGIVCVSGAAASLYCLNKEGEYEETLAHIPGLEDEKNPQIGTYKQGEYFIAMPEAGKIIRCYNKK